MAVARVVIVSVMLVLMAYAPSFAARDITLPFTLSFDSSDYDDLLWNTGGATHTNISSGCWSGSCAKITPPTDCATGGYMGLGSFTGLNHPQVNIRFLMKVGSTYASTASNCGGEGLGNKLVDSLQVGDAGRSLVGLLIDSHVPAGGAQTFGMCTSGPSGTDYNCDNAGGGISPCNYWSASGAHEVVGCGYDRLHFGGDITTDYDNQWISVEVELVRNGYNKIYIYTQDGVLAGLYVTNDALSNDYNWSYIRHIGGYSNQDHPTADANTYIMFDELQISTSYIGPPTGFIGSRKLNNVTGVRVTLH